MAITERNKKILIDINYANRYLSNKSKFINEGIEIKTFNKNEILKIIKELGYPCKYLGEGGYEIRKSFEDYGFELIFVITRNTPLIYQYIYKNGKLIEEESPVLLSKYLHYIPYDEKLINNNFKLKSLEEMKEYLKGNLEIFEDYVDQYIKTIKNE